MSKLQRLRFKYGQIYLYPPLKLSFSMCGLWTTFAQNPRSTAGHRIRAFGKMVQKCAFLVSLLSGSHAISNFKGSILIHLSLDTRRHTPVHPVEPSLYYFIAFYHKAFFSSVTLFGLCIHSFPSVLGMFWYSPFQNLLSILFFTLRSIVNTKKYYL